MWDYESLMGKARTYFGRAFTHDRLDDEFLIWNVLGLEFLLRAPLARVSPMLLASPDDGSVLAAAGIPISSQPKSIPTHTVITRLRRIVADFNADRVLDAEYLLNVRNAELHTGDAAAANVDDSAWLPKLIRVARVIADHLSEDLSALLGGDTVALGDKLVGDEDRKLKHSIEEKIRTLRSAFTSLDADEQETRREAAMAPPWSYHSVDCPVCGTRIVVTVEEARRTSPRFQDDSLVVDVVYVATGLSCKSCGLQLGSTAEVHAAGIEQQFHGQEKEDLQEQYRESFYDDDYGNE